LSINNFHKFSIYISFRLTTNDKQECLSYCIDCVLLLVRNTLEIDGFDKQECLSYCIDCVLLLVRNTLEIDGFDKQECLSY
jgi:hypothetical protein